MIVQKRLLMNKRVERELGGEAQVPKEIDV